MLAIRKSAILHLEHLPFLVAQVVDDFCGTQPDLGLSNRREVLLFSEAQASALISAFSVVFGSDTVHNGIVAG